MRWPWGRNITKLQAVEVGKLCLNLCQATLIGTVGIFFISKFNVYVRGILILSGIMLAMLLFTFAMLLFEEVKRYESSF